MWEFSRIISQEDNEQIKRYEIELIKSAVPEKRIIQMALPTNSTTEDFEMAISEYLAGIEGER